MKKTILLIVLCTLGSYALKAEKNDLSDGPKDKKSIMLSAGSDKEITESGFFVNIGGVLPSSNYFFSVGLDNDTSLKFGFGPCLELGHMFRIVDMENMAIGVRATWLSAFYTTLRWDDTTSSDVIQGSIIKLGPYFTYGLSDNAAFDFYYQIAPTHASLIEGGEGYAHFGATQSMGFGFRFSVLNVGMDYNFGTVKSTDAPKDIDPDFKKYYRIRTNHLRLFIGIKI